MHKKRAPPICLQFHKYQIQLATCHKNQEQAWQQNPNYKPKMKLSTLTAGTNIYIFQAIHNTDAGIPSAITTALTASTTYIKNKGIKGIAKDIDSMVSLAKNAKTIKELTSEISNEFDLELPLHKGKVN